MSGIKPLVNKGVTVMRRGFGFLWVVLTGILLALVGTIAYQAGWSAGVATHVADGAAGAGPYYYGGPGVFGFGFLWVLFIPFLIFVFFPIARVGRGWGYGCWGDRPRYGSG